MYVDPAHEGIAKAGEAGSYPCFGGPELGDPSLLLAWSPGGTPTVYGAGAGLRVPRGAHFVVQVHYHPVAAATTGRLDVEVEELARPPAHPASFVLVGNAASADGEGARLLPGPSDPPSGPAFVIPSNAKQHVEAMELVAPPAMRPVRLAAVGAHMHWAGVELRLEIERASGGETECLLRTSYDFNWQRTYAYDEPLERLPVLRAGDVLRITCTYDNTEDNPYIARLMTELRRSSPPEIHLGATGADEMCQAMLVLVE